MSLAGSLASEQTPIAAPVGSVLSRPASAVVPKAGDHLSDRKFEPEIVHLRPPIQAFKGIPVRDPMQLRLRQYQDDEIRSILDQATALAKTNPRSTVAWARLAQMLGSLGQSEEAVDAARRVFRLSTRSRSTTESGLPDRASELIAARVLLSGGLGHEAEGLLAKLTEPSGPWTLLYAAIAEDRGEHAQALARLGDASGPEAAAFRGYLMLRLGRWQVAIQQLRRAGGEGSRNPDLLANLSYAYAVVGSSRKAIRAARQAALLAPRSRRLTFNLVGLLLGADQSDDALRELRRLRGERGEDLKITAVLAHVLASQDRLVEARRELRRGLARHPFGRNQVDYAELVANLAFLELRVGQRTRGEVLAELRKQIDAIDGQSLALALMFADLVHRTTARTEVARLYDGLLRHESEEDLLPLKVRLLLFEQDYESARREVRRWVEVAPLNPDAAQTLVTIEGQIFADFASAAKVGREALKRFPGYVLLRNNVAFALALSDQIAEAQAILGESREDEPPFLYATRGLIALAAGSIQEGLDLYDKAVASADEQGGDSESAIEFRRLARAYEWLGLQKFGLATGDLPSERCDVVLPDDWQVDNNYLILRELAARIGAPWPPGSDHKG